MRDKQVELIINNEQNRQEDEVCLIASENYTYDDVKEAQGSCLTNKYAEGYPGNRYYAGCKFIDEIENIAIERCKRLFMCNYANVQPHSGSQANQAVYAALLKPGDRVLAMDLNSGAHITHVSKASYTSKLYEPYYYGLDKDGFIDYDSIYKMLLEVKPKLLIAGASAYAREIDFRRIREMLDRYHTMLRSENKLGTIKENQDPNCMGNSEELGVGKYYRVAHKNGPATYLVCKEVISFFGGKVGTWEEQSNIPDCDRCYFMVDMAHIAGLVATSDHMSPVPYADVVTFTTHKILRGPRGGCIITNDKDLAKKIDLAVFPRTQGGPLEHVIAGKAICFDRASTDDYTRYIYNVLKNVDTMVKVFKEEKIDMVSKGSSNHLILLDLRKYGISGLELENRLSSIGIIANKNAVPGDTRSKKETSGLRIGTPAITTRGFGKPECIKLAQIISRAIKTKDWSATEEEIQSIKDMCRKFSISSATQLK